jgi:hypothetical protein
VILELIDHVVRDSVAFQLGQSLPQTAHNLAGSAEREGDFVSEHVAAGRWDSRCPHIHGVFRLVASFSTCCRKPGARALAKAFLIA